VRQRLGRCRNQGDRIVVVVGHPQFHPRFGFSSARTKGLEAPFPVSYEAFMVELGPGVSHGSTGTVSYPQEFLDV
jgi:putative acetyltransferase